MTVLIVFYIPYFLRRAPLCLHETSASTLRRTPWPCLYDGKAQRAVPCVKCVWDVPLITLIYTSRWDWEKHCVNVALPLWPVFNIILNLQLIERLSIWLLHWNTIAFENWLPWWYIPACEILFNMPKPKEI